MKKRLDVLFAIIFCVVAAATGASIHGQGTNTDEGRAMPGVPRHLKLAFVTNNPADFWTIARKGVEQAQKEVPNIEVVFRMPADGTAAEQTRLVNNLLARGVDGFAISPVDPANETALLNKAASHALVFTQDSDAPNSRRACYIGTDNRAAGKQAGELIRKALPNGGSIMLFVGKSDSQNAKDRIQGIRDALAGANIKILGVRTDDADHTAAELNVANTLVKYPHIAGLVGIWSYNGPAILSAVQDANKVGKVKIIAFDEELQTLAGVKSGAIFGTIVQQPFEFGRQSIIDLAKVLRGDKSVIPTNKHIAIPTLVIDRSNVDAYSARLAKLKA